MAASDEDPIALRMLLAEWERQLTEARAHQEEASGDFRDIRNQLCNLMEHMASLSASCGHGASSGMAQTARMPVSYASAHAAAGSRPVQAPASHFWQTRCTKSTHCMNGRVSLHAPAVPLHGARQRFSVSSSGSAS